MRANSIYLVLIALIAVFVGAVSLPIDHPEWLDRMFTPANGEARDLREFKLGLDLQGGTQVLLEADMADGQTPEDGAMDAAKTIVENRVNALGVAEAIVQLQGDDRMIVELPGVDNPDQAVETLRSTGQLEFVDPGSQFLSSGMIINTTNHPTLAADLEEEVLNGVISPAELPYPDQVFNTVMTGEILRNAIASQDQFAQWLINFELTAPGSEQFFNYTRANVGRQLAIVLDGRVLSAPEINDAIRDSGVIQGAFTQDEAESLAVQMRYGALPIPLAVVDIRTIGASLGQDSIDSSLQAGILGILAVLLYMILMYRVPGLLSSIALVIYVGMNLAIFKMVPVTLTLAGIAGFLLSVGMAVDANILIFERLKEELRVGRTLRLAVETGFNRAWLAIRDGNLSTLISCAVLYWFGNTFGASVVKGFAITLSIGVLLSMFTAVFITRTFMRATLARNARNSASRAWLGY